MLLLNETVLCLKEKQNTNLHSKSFMTDLLNISFNDFGIWLPGNRIQFSCLHIPYKLYLLVLCGYEVQIFFVIYL